MMRRHVKTFPALDQPLLIMGMPPGPFLLATMAAALAPVVFGFHLLALVPAALYPGALALLRRIGRQDPQRFHVLAEHIAFFHRFYHPVGLAGARGARRIDRRALLP